MNAVKINYENFTTLPNSFITEQAILNILLNNPALVKKVVRVLKSQSFYFEPHRIIYEILYELCENEQPINLTMLINTLQNKELLSKIGGIDRLILIINRLENFLDLDTYIKILNDKYLRRLVVELGKQIIAWGYITSIDLDEILEKIENAIFNLSQQKISEKIYSAAEILDEIFIEMTSKIKRREQEILKSSFHDFDSILQGFEKSDLIIIAGRPSMGKTAFALNLGKNIVENYNIPLIIFTLEMSRQQIVYRLIANESKINTNRLKTGKMKISEWQELSRAMKHISQLPIFIDDDPTTTLIQIRSKIRKIFLQKVNQGLVIIDYLQLMKLNFKLENRVQEISHITRNLKLMAKEFQIPIIVLSQLSRGLESRVNKRPMLSDLRESGCLSKLQTKTPIKITSWNQNINILQTIEKIEFKGFKPTYCLTFKNNTKISLTSNHRLLSKQGWIKITQINVNSEFWILTRESEEKNKIDYCKIKEIKYEGINEVYEKTIPIYHNYFYKSFLVHNSIEQDADIVIMLYREDYYTEKKKNEQITELIIAKHRNGPIGTARLLFNPYLTTFTNIIE